MSDIARLGLLLGLCGMLPTPAGASDCETPQPEWLMCEDFERGDAGWASWFSSSGFVECRGCADGSNDPERLFLSNDPDHVFDGNYAMHMPATAASEYQGGELVFRSCVGDARQGCDLTNYDRLYLRTRVKLAADHEYVHHFVSIGGTRPDAYWEGSGNAGCRPNGVRHAGTTVDFDRDRNLFFYTSFPEMRCDSGGYCSGSYATNICDGCATRDLPCESGPECCWGNRYESPSAAVIPRGEWVCLEMMMKINAPGESDGEMAFWINDAAVHNEVGMHWRDVPELGLNRANMSHYIARGDADRPNRISFDDFIVSTERIGCDMTPMPAPDAGPVPVDAGGLDASSDAMVSTDGGSPDAGTSASGGCSATNTPAGGMAVLILLAWRRRSARIDTVRQ